MGRSLAGEKFVALVVAPTLTSKELSPPDLGCSSSDAISWRWSVPFRRCCLCDAENQVTPRSGLFCDRGERSSTPGRVSGLWSLALSRARAYVCCSRGLCCCCCSRRSESVCACAKVFSCVSLWSQGRVIARALLSGRRRGASERARRRRGEEARGTVLTLGVDSFFLRRTDGKRKAGHVCVRKGGCFEARGEGGAGGGRKGSGGARNPEGSRPAQRPTPTPSPSKGTVGQV
jgi:hypothetical protein